MVHTYDLYSTHWWFTTTIPSKHVSYAPYSQRVTSHRMTMADIEILWMKVSLQAWTDFVTWTLCTLIKYILLWHPFYMWQCWVECMVGDNDLDSIVLWIEIVISLILVVIYSYISCWVFGILHPILLKQHSSCLGK